MAFLYFLFFYFMYFCSQVVFLFPLDYPLLCCLPHVPFCLSLDHLLALCVIVALSACISPMLCHGSRAQHGAVRCPSSVSPDRPGHKWIYGSFWAKGWKLSSGNQRLEPDESLGLHANTTGTDWCTVGYMLLMLSEFCMSQMQ